jgi:hypothetical protein
MAGTPARNGNNEAGNNDSSRKTVEMCQWPALPWATPAARDFRFANSKPFSERGGGAKGEQLQNLAKHLCAWPANPDALDVARILNLETELKALVDSGVTTVGFLLDRNGWEIVPASGQLNASHSRWLMGLPEIWDRAAIAASRLLKGRKRASRGSEATETPLSPRKRRRS